MDYSQMEREELMGEVRKRPSLSIKGQPGKDRLVELLAADDERDMVGPVIQEDDTLDMDELSEDFSESSPGMDQFREAARNPFTGYPIKLIKARYYPRDPLIDRMSKEDLTQFCIRNEFLHRSWVVRRGFDKQDKDQHERILGIEMDGWDADRLRQYVDQRQTHTFPSHHLVFTRIKPPKPGVPHIIAMKSWFTKRHRSIWFDLQWPMPTPENPYQKGDPMRCAVVDDDSLRAQLFYTRQHITGKIISRKIGNDSKIDSYFLLRKPQDDQARSAPLLHRIFEQGTRGSKLLQDWEKDGGLPDLQ